MNEKYQNMIRLGWDILKYKYHYYVNNKGIISDLQYDMIEKEYEALCKEFNVEPSATDMVGFKWERPACKLVAGREQRPPKKKDRLVKKNTKHNGN